MEPKQLLCSEAINMVVFLSDTLLPLQACSGNVNAMTEVARDLGMGLLAGVAVNPDMLTTATENMVSVFAKLDSMKAEREGPGFSQRLRRGKQSASSLGGYHHRHHHQQQTGYNDPFLKFANEMFVAYTNPEPYWSGGIPMSVEGNDNAQSYYGREEMSPSISEATFHQADHGRNGEL